MAEIGLSINGQPSSIVEGRTLLEQLLTGASVIEGTLQSHLGERFDVTLLRFDLMAQLDPLPDGMDWSDLSKLMMGSNANLTELVGQLVKSGDIDRRTSLCDRRGQVIRLTKAGRAAFRKMAAEHRKWIADIFSDFAANDILEMTRLLAKIKS
ncbi:MarR family winged helix-turn-helix transcriptional regulator [Afipia sp. GAS231]|uniref:MarR family winged helix-turn-helix transcriptional regulator n=1 Tax=Afipia sp. GAS231 TaxID=1882747 RepID=UPI00087A344A|nr:transcriptional regulator [Afipia sp. GAS231]SDO50512.1 DNA-binding transcriptional regulator, MarR family [Afipia sp. GAS231]